MHELPSNFNKNLPSHKVVMANGTVRDVDCPGGKVRDISMDVGEFLGGCRFCCGEFVYLFKSNTWILDSEFDKLVLDSAGTIGKTIQSF
jgi:hypothetical protein